MKEIGKSGFGLSFSLRSMWRDASGVSSERACICAVVISVMISSETRARAQMKIKSLHLSVPASRANF